MGPVFFKTIGNGQNLHNRGLDWILRILFFFWKVVQILEQAAQRSGAMTISESGQGVAVALEVSGEHSGDGLMVELSDFRGLSLS